MSPRHPFHVFTALSVVSPLLAIACGDDESAPSTPIETDAGADADSPTSAPTSARETNASSQALQTTEPRQDICTAIATSCSGKDDADGLGNLCLRVADNGNAEECESVSSECEIFCGSGDVPSRDGGELSEELCKAMGDTCHDFDEGDGLGHLCHEIGHVGNLAWCDAIFDECVALCGEPDEHHDDHDASDSSDANPAQSLTIQFAAKVDELDFECGAQYADFGSADSVVTPQDLRFYVSGIRLLTPTGEQVSVEIDELSPFQGGGVALLDFENGSGECRNGSEVTNTAIQVTAPAGEYTGIAFSTSVPTDLNHGDPLSLPAPLQAGDMTWGWLFGYKFLKAEFVQVLPASTLLDAGSADAGMALAGDAGDDSRAVVVDSMAMDAMAPMAGVGLFHLGSTGCTNLLGQDAGANEFEVTCAKPSFNDIVLEGFSARTNVVTLDLARVFADTDLSTMSMCHGDGASCPALFASVGVDFQTGAAQTQHSAFRVD